MPKFLDALSNATKDDYDAISTRLSEIDKERETLKAAQIILAKQLGIAAVASTNGQSKKLRTRTLRLAIARRMNQQPGGVYPKAPFVKEFNLSDGEFEHLTEHQFFSITPQGVKLTTAGMIAAGKAAA